MSWFEVIRYYTQSLWKRNVNISGKRPEYCENVRFETSIRLDVFRTFSMTFSRGFFFIESMYWKIRNNNAWSQICSRADSHLLRVIVKLHYCFDILFKFSAYALLLVFFNLSDIYVSIAIITAFLFAMYSRIFLNLKFLWFFRIYFCDYFRWLAIITASAISFAFDT